MTDRNSTRGAAECVLDAQSEWRCRIDEVSGVRSERKARGASGPTSAFS